MKINKKSFKKKVKLCIAIIMCIIALASIGGIISYVANSVSNTYNSVQDTKVENNKGSDISSDFQSITLIVIMGVVIVTTIWTINDYKK